MRKRPSVTRTLLVTGLLLVLITGIAVVYRFPVVPADRSYDSDYGWVQLISVSSEETGSGVEITWEVEFGNRAGVDLRFVPRSACGPHVLAPWSGPASEPGTPTVTVPKGQATGWNDSCPVERIGDRFFYELELHRADGGRVDGGRRDGGSGDGGSKELAVVFTGIAPEPTA